MSERLTVITIPQATANGPLHLGHLSGPYLASDIAARAARARGERVLALAGIDVHQNYVLTKAENEGLPVDAMIDEYRTRILDAYTRARLSWEAYYDPSRDEGYRAGVARVVADLVERGTLPMRDFTLHQCADCGRTLHHSYVVGTCATCGSGASGGSCEGCGGFTSAHTLLNPACDRCGGAAREVTTTVPVLRLEDYREELLAVWAQAELTPRVRELVGHYLRAGLPEVPMAYPTNWGIEGTGPLAGMRIEVYAEVAIAYLFCAARHLDPDVRGVDDCAAAWERIDGLWHFHGIDNAFYFALFIPAFFAAAGVRPAALRGLVVNEFCTLEGKKFSTSRNHAIWADEFLATEDPAIVRLYLAWNRPDSYETDFTHESYRAFRDMVAPLLAGHAPAGAVLPAELVAAEVERAEQALRPESFDPALAVRAALAGLAGGSERAARVLAVLAGEAGGAATGGAATGEAATGGAATGKVAVER